MTESLDHYESGAARALVRLHEQRLRSFLEVWKRAKAADVTLPETEDENYASLETLLKHVLGAAGWYMETVCKSLGLPDPGIDPVPDTSEIVAKMDAYAAHLSEKWRLPLADIGEAQLYPPVRTTSDGAKLNLDAMLEHAVMHPIRHEFQLKNLLEAQT